MKKKQELCRKITELIKETKTGHIQWEVICQTTEYNPTEEKPVTEEDGVRWFVDECYVSYHCKYKGEEFLMISYEMIHTAEEKKKTTNLIFLPPLGIRIFEIHALLPYSIETDQMLTYQVHMLWLTILDLYKKQPDKVSLDASERVLTIED